MIAVSLSLHKVCWNRKDKFSNEKKFQEIQRIYNHSFGYLFWNLFSSLTFEIAAILTNLIISSFNLKVENNAYDVLPFSADRNVIRFWAQIPNTDLRALEIET